MTRQEPKPGGFMPREGVPWDLLTRDQVARALADWGCVEPPPGKGKALFVAFPLSMGFVYPLVKVTKTDRPATCGGKLWLLEYLRA